jgi:hypothetical protein
MPFGAIKIKPGINAEQTMTLNEAGISTSQFVRFRDGLPEKLGGWNSYPVSNNTNCKTTYTGRALHAWEATNIDVNTLSPSTYLAIGQTSGLSYIKGNTVPPSNISPYNQVNNWNPTFSQTINVTVATTAPINYDSSYSPNPPPFYVLTPYVVDGYALNTGDTVLIKDQANPTQNGIYVFFDLAFGFGTLSRASNFDTSAEMLNYTKVFVTKGTSNLYSTWYLVWQTTSQIVIGTDPIIFAEYFYVSAVVQPDCRVATIANLTATYNNGTSGVGATLTSNAYVSGPVIDGVTLAINDRVLVKNQTNTYENGIYTVTTLGTGGIYWVLTRATNFDQPSEMVKFAFVNIVGGVSNANTAWYLTSAVTTVGTTPALFTQYHIGITTQVGSNIVTISDVSVKPNVYWAVNIETPISIGGLILFGLYQIESIVSATQYTILAAGNATATVINGGEIPLFTTTNNSVLVNVNLVDHGFNVGDFASFPIATTANNVTILGDYRVLAVIDVNNYTISTSSAANADGSFYMNGGVPYYYYWVGLGPTSTTYPTGSTIYSPNDWTLDNWGQVLVACGLGGPICLWDPTSNNNNATVLPYAPAVNQGAFVAMPQRQIIAYGSTFTGTQDPLLIRWCNVEDYTDWFATSQNQAGSYRIATGSKIIGGFQGPQQAYIWTDLDLWSMIYNGSNTVYSFTKISSGCGLLGQKCFGQLGPNIYWMSQKQFFVANSSGISPIKCPIWDVVFQDYNPSYSQYFRCATNAQFNEVAWFYSSLTNSNPTKPDKYVKYNVAENVWDYGTLTRTAWLDQSILGPPIAMDDLHIYQHEVSKNAGINWSTGADVAMNSSFETGYAVLNAGEDYSFVDWIIPDMKWGYYDGTQTASLRITIYVTNYPGDTPLAYGPYTVQQATEYINTRFRGRQIAFKVESTDLNSFWRLGNIRFRYATDGRR